MIDKRKTRTVDGTTERATETAAFGRAAISYSDSTTDGAGRQIKIYDLLGEGADNGLSLRDLVRITEMDERSVRRMINFERRAKMLICSDNKNGYFRPANLSEAKRYTRSMQHRAREIARVAAAAEEAIADAEGQTEIEGW